MAADVQRTVRGKMKEAAAAISSVEAVQAKNSLLMYVSKRWNRNPNF